MDGPVFTRPMELTTAVGGMGGGTAAAGHSPQMRLNASSQVPERPVIPTATSPAGQRAKFRWSGVPPPITGPSNTTAG